MLAAQVTVARFAVVIEISATNDATPYAARVQQIGPHPTKGYATEAELIATLNWCLGEGNYLIVDRRLVH